MAKYGWYLPDGTPATQKQIGDWDSFQNSRNEDGSLRAAPEGITPLSNLTDRDAFYTRVASGKETISADNFNSLFTEDDRGLRESEFARFSPETQAWAKANPQAFMTSLLANRNRANSDLGSVGAEGGYKDLGAVTAGDKGLDYSKAGYMDIHEDMDPMVLFALTAFGLGAAGMFGAGGAAAEGAAASSGAAEAGGFADAVWSSGATINPYVSTALQGIESTLSVDNLITQLGKELVTSTVTGRDFSLGNVGTNLLTSGVSNVSGNFMPGSDGTIATAATRAGVQGTAGGLISAVRGGDFGEGFTRGAVSTGTGDLLRAGNDAAGNPLTGNTGNSLINNTAGAVGNIAAGMDPGQAATGAVAGFAGDAVRGANLTSDPFWNGVLGSTTSQLVTGVINSTATNDPNNIVPDTTVTTPITTTPAQTDSNWKPSKFKDYQGKQFAEFTR